MSKNPHGQKNPVTGNGQRQMSKEENTGEAYSDNSPEFCLTTHQFSTVWDRGSLLWWH